MPAVASDPHESRDAIGIELRERGDVAQRQLAPQHRRGGERRRARRRRHARSARRSRPRVPRAAAGRRACRGTRSSSFTNSGLPSVASHTARPRRVRWPARPAGSTRVVSSRDRRGSASTSPSRPIFASSAPASPRSCLDLAIRADDEQPRARIPRASACRKRQRRQIRRVQIVEHDHQGCRAATSASDAAAASYWRKRTRAGRRPAVARRERVGEHRGPRTPAPTGSTPARRRPPSTAPRPRETRAPPRPPPRAPPDASCRCRPRPRPARARRARRPRVERTRASCSSSRARPTNTRSNAIGRVA